MATEPAPLIVNPPAQPARPAWRVRAMLEAVAWARRHRIPYSPFVAVKALA